MARPLVTAAKVMPGKHTLQVRPDPLTILTAIPFMPDPSQAEYMERTLAGQIGGFEAYRLLEESADGISACSHWSMSKSDAGKIYGQDLSHLANGMIKRLTAVLPVTATFIANRKLDRVERSEQTIIEIGGSHRCREVVFAAAERAQYEIGRGIQDVALILLEMGLLRESRLIEADTRWHNHRFLIRDALFSSEDLSLSGMAKLLWNVREDGNSFEGADPLIFVHCAGYGRTYEEGVMTEFVILEALDFQSLDNIMMILDSDHEDRSGGIRRVQDALSIRRVQQMVSKRRAAGFPGRGR